MIRKTMRRDRKSTIWRFSAAFILIGLILVLAGCGQQTPPVSHGLEDGRHSEMERDGEVVGIVNGSSHLTSVSKSLSKSVVALISVSEQGQALCTGSIIAEDLILTAAHCVEGRGATRPEPMVLVFNPKLDSAKTSDRRDVVDIVQHPRWRRASESGRGDLALVYFTGGLPKGYVPLKLAGEDLKVEIGETVGMLGYGVDSGVSETGSGILRKTNTKVLGHKSATEIMTDGKKTSVCFGDSGGPAFVKSGKSWIQWGVASSVTNRACNGASIHTAVMDYLDWIKEAGDRLRR